MYFVVASQAETSFKPADYMIWDQTSDHGEYSHDIDGEELLKQIAIGKQMARERMRAAKPT